MHLSLLEEFDLAAHKSWSGDIAYGGEWSPENPSRNMCAITALAVAQYFEGSKIVRQSVTIEGCESESHYFNILADGRIYDPTREQYAAFQQGVSFGPP